ncbi:glycosyltransferase family 4 protein [Aquabacter cavernae]|uniref:glycosyltransferase family 4 protein n=1 Tax=Aquabacter cavernae TaxID=2496029 RepID=UPI000F8CD4CA|nr:glycosyltransferase family 1 protein [Aquabacter cavernae]
MDCSLTPLTGTPTGIPRVLRKYLTYAPAAARAAGMDFMAVEIAAPGRFRRFREVGEPRADPGRPLSAGDIGARCALVVLRYVSPVLKHLLHLIGAVLPVRLVRKTTDRWARSADKFVSKFRRRFNVQPRVREEVTFRPGDVLLCPGCFYHMDMEDYAAARAQGAEVVVVLHDILPVTVPQTFEYPWRWDFKQRIVQALDIVAHFYCISRQTQDELKRFAATLDKPVRTAVAYNGIDPVAVGPVSPPSDPERRALLARRPWLMVGTVEPRKGYGEAVAAFEALWRAGYDRPLVIIGGKGWLAHETQAPILESPWLGKNLFWFRQVDDETLAAFYEGSHALLAASISEGFGLPLLEAPAHGLPVLYRQVPAFREILGDRAPSFASHEELKAGLLDMEAPGRRAEICAALAQLRWYDWPSVVEAVVADLMAQTRTLDASIVPEEVMRPVRAGGAGVVQLDVAPAGSLRGGMEPVSGRQVAV